jgi:hypothetical protein
MSTQPMTYAEYMKPSESHGVSWDKHQSFYLQFATPSTYQFVETCVGLDNLRRSKDKCFNDIIKHSNGGGGGWVWDNSPVNLTLMAELGLVRPGSRPSLSDHTCVGKAAARELLRREGIIRD